MLKYLFIFESFNQWCIYDSKWVPTIQNIYKYMKNIIFYNDTYIYMLYYAVCPMPCV